MSDRVTPHSLDAERSVLGAILIDNEAYPSAAAIVSTEMFFRRGHQIVWRHLAKRLEANEPVDLALLVDSLRATGELDDAGGPAYVAALVDMVPRATNVDAYARNVRGYHQRRELIKVGTSIVDKGFRSDEDVDTLIDQSEHLVMALGKASVKGDFQLAEDWMMDTYGTIERAQQRRQVVTGVPTSLPRLDMFTRGLQPSDLIYVGARPSVGKTSLALQMALCASESVMTGFVSLEMSKRVVGQRAVAMEARVDLFRLMTGHLNDAEYRRVGEAIGRISGRRLAIDDASGMTGAQLRAKVRRLASRYGLGIVIIDYLQLIRSGERSESRNLELATISASLKELAKELDIPVVVLSQLSRDAAKTNREPRLDDLRDSGSLEQDADLVLLLHRPKQHDEGQKFADGETAHLIIAKQRNGPTGRIELAWLGEQVRFGELADREAVA